MGINARICRGISFRNAELIVAKVQIVLTGKNGPFIRVEIKIEILVPKARIVLTGKNGPFRIRSNLIR